MKYISQEYTLHNAFTMMELVMVIVVVGIISAAIIPRTGSNKLAEAAVQLISDIRYTQHLALVDDKYNPNIPNWYRQRWQLAFSTSSNTLSYMIFSDSISNKGAYDGNPGANAIYTDVEVARNPLNTNLFMIGAANTSFNNYDTSRLTSRLDIKREYGIEAVKMSGGTSSPVKRVLFDHIGRPYRGSGSSTSANPLNSPVDFVATSTIKIKLCTKKCVGNNATANNENELIIAIEPETGYAHIL